MRPFLQDSVVTPLELAEVGYIRSAQDALVKILGRGDIDVAITVSAQRFSDLAREKIEDAGGTVAVIGVGMLKSIATPWTSRGAARRRLNAPSAVGESPAAVI